MKQWPLLLLATGTAVASTGVPPSFDLDGEKAVFPDFMSAHYDIVYDFETHTARSTADIELKSAESGHVVFDLVADPTLVTIDGEETQAPVTPSPDNATQFRVISKSVPSGIHRLHIQSPLSAARFTPEGELFSVFAMLDVDEDRDFLEAYLPASFEWDPYQMSFHVKLVGTQAAHELFVNGQKTQVADNEWNVEFPSYFSNSSVFYHLAPRRMAPKLEFSWTSVDGRNVPGVVFEYGGTEQSLNQFRDAALQTIHKMEADIGPWAHPSAVFFNTGPGGGMEYSGATATSLWALPHELAHNFFGRAAMPANGASGWVDEAMASWYSDLPATPRDRAEPMGRQNLASFSPYARRTQSDGYSQGANLLAYLNHLSSNKLMPCLSTWFHDERFERYTSETLKSEFEGCMKLDLSAVFNESVFGRGPGILTRSPEPARSPFHMTRAQRDQIYGVSSHGGH